MTRAVETWPGDGYAMGEFFGHRRLCIVPRDRSAPIYEQEMNEEAHGDDVYGPWRTTGQSLDSLGIEIVQTDPHERVPESVFDLVRARLSEMK